MLKHEWRLPTESGSGGVWKKGGGWGEGGGVSDMSYNCQPAVYIYLNSVQYI